MNNQNNNTNEMFGSNGNNQEQPINPIPTPNPEIKSEGLETTVLPQVDTMVSSAINQNMGFKNQGENIAPVMPTLDSILNPPEEDNTSFNNETLNSGIVNTSIENNTAVVDDSWKTVSEISPTIESIPNNMLKEETAQPETLNSVNMENTVENLSGPVINSETIIEAPAPVVETIEPTPNEMTSIPTQPENLETSIPSSTGNMETLATEPLNTTSTETLTDDFSQVPVPPVFEDDKKNKSKKGGKKGLIGVLIVILILAIGFGVYYFLSLAKESATTSITTKELKVELGSTLSNNIEDYATISGYNKNDCKLNLNNVNINKVSTYKFTVTCGKENVEGTIIVDDTTKPEVLTNDLVLLPNATLKAEDFISKCFDASKCSYSFQTDVTNLTSTLGEHEVEILVSDEYNNQNVVKAKLTISREAPVRYLKCSKKEEQLQEMNAMFSDSYRIGIDDKDNFYNAVRSSEFTFDTLSDYNKAVNDYKGETGIYNIIGNANFYESNKLIVVKSNKTLEDMNKELNGRLPNNSNVLRAYLSGLGYICE